MKLSMIVAIARNGVIGRDNALPWHLPEDLKYFKRVTMGKPVLMGRKTYESIGRPLPGRRNIVITRDPSWRPADLLGSEQVAVVASVHQALQAAAKDGAEEAMVIGGAEIYRACLAEVERIYLTEVDAEIDGDAFLQLDLSGWECVSNESHEPCDKNFYPYAFKVYDRR